VLPRHGIRSYLIYLIVTLLIDTGLVKQKLFDVYKNDRSTQSIIYPNLEITFYFKMNIVLNSV
jgi:hypothetical protein